MLLGFQKRFEKKIRTKQKRHTIRAKRKRRPHVGEVCHCYTGLRRKGARLLGRWLCVKIQDIQIYRRGDGTLGVVIDRLEVLFDELDPLARSDGFQDFADMTAFWLAEHSDRQGNIDFHGDMIHWDPDRPQPGPNKAKRRRS